jgi:hypothetical protein
MFSLLKLKISLVLLFISTVLFCQSQTDTLNKYNSKKKKEGYWTFYFDSLFNRCEANNAKYYGYMYYHNGDTKLEPVARSSKRDSIEYKPFYDTVNSKPILLNGDIFHYFIEGGAKKIYIQDTYKNGIQTMGMQNFFSSRSQGTEPEADIYYLDSLYNNDKLSFLYYKKDKGMLIYKKYVGTRKKVERTFFVEHEDFKSVDGVILGGYLSGELKDTLLRPRNFVEFGYSKKFRSGTTIKLTDRTYHDNLANFSFFKVSAMASNSNGKWRYAQKMTYGYTLVILQGEIGLINYTDFVHHDPRLILGLGFTLFGNGGAIFYFSIPFIRNTFDDVPKFTMSVGLH